MSASPAPAPAALPGARPAPRGRWPLVGVVIAFFVLLATLTRVALLLSDRTIVAGNGAGALLHAFVVGFVYDLLVALWLAAPVALWLTLVRSRGTTGRGARIALTSFLALLLFVGCFTAAAEWFFFDEFNGRFNFVAVDYLIYPTEVVTNIWQSYHLGWALLVLAVLTALLLRPMRALVRQALATPVPLAPRLAGLSAYAAVLAVLTLAVSPGLARVSDDRALNEIASSGYYTFFQALLGVDAPYEGWYAASKGDPVPRLQALLADSATDPATWRAGTTLRRERALVAAPARPLNVVLVLEESFGSKFVGTLGGQGITPRFDSLAAEGTLLANAYSTGNRTIRALEATTTSLPPLPGIAVVRRAASKELFTLPSVLKAHGYRTMFVYGGRALFDNMGAYMRANGMERVIEQSDYPDTSFTTAWGVSDEAIFDKALAEMDTLDRAGKPFYVNVLTVSNHKPYTYPTGRIAEDPRKKRRTYAVKYADWALGRFVRQARAHPWFDHTLFVLMGDHGARVYGAQEIPLPSYEVPILFYGPGIVPTGRRLTTLASSLDVPPSILGFLGFDYDSKFFGTDVFHQDPARGRAFMTHNEVVSLMRGDTIAVLGLHQSVGLFRVDTAGNRLVRLGAPSGDGQRLVDDAISYYEGADRLYRAGKYRFAP